MRALVVAGVLLAGACAPAWPSPEECRAAWTYRCQMAAERAMDEDAVTYCRAHPSEEGCPALLREEDGR